MSIYNRLVVLGTESTTPTARSTSSFSVATTIPNLVEVAKKFMAHERDARGGHRRP